MHASTSLRGASRLPLTPKRGNKDYYKGTRQAFVPGGGHRTGAPGAHVVRGSAKYRIMDERVRVYVGPGIDKIEGSMLQPYASTKTAAITPPALPPFGPQPVRADGSKPQPRDFVSFSRAYVRLSSAERQALVQQQRRAWWGELSALFAAPKSDEVEEGRTREVEARADKEA